MYRPMLKYTYTQLINFIIRNLNIIDVILTNKTIIINI